MKILLICTAYILSLYLAVIAGYSYITWEIHLPFVHMGDWGYDDRAALLVIVMSLFGLGIAWERL